MSAETIEYYGWEIQAHWCGLENRWIAQAQKPPEFNLHGIATSEQDAIERVKEKIDRILRSGS
jgi:hypothetical protein